MERYLKNKLENGVFSGVSEKTQKTMSAIKSKNNKTTEVKLKMALIRNGISGWKTNYKDIIGTPDIYFPKYKLAIYIDGCFWHGCPKCGHIPKTRTEYWTAKIQRNKQRDNKVNNENMKCGVNVLRFWEHEIKDSIGLNHVIVLILEELCKYDWN